MHVAIDRQCGTVGAGEQLAPLSRVEREDHPPDPSRAARPARRHARERAGDALA
jgi:hypothetical protein